MTETHVAFDAKVCLTLLGSAVGGTRLQPLQKVPAEQAKAQGHCFVPWAMGGSTTPFKDVEGCPLGKKGKICG